MSYRRRSITPTLLGTVALGALLVSGCTIPPANLSAPKAELRDVPPRPSLGYTIEQRREIGEALVADRENARYQGEQLRQRTGKTALPPPPMPRIATPEPAPARRIEPPSVANTTPIPNNPEAEIAEERVQAESDDGSLNSFLRRLLRQQPQPPPSEPVVAVAAVKEPSDEDLKEAEQRKAARRPEPPETPALDRFLGFLGGPLAAPANAGAPGTSDTAPGVAPATDEAAKTVEPKAVANIGTPEPARANAPPKAAEPTPLVKAAAPTQLAATKPKGPLRLEFTGESIELSPAAQAQVREYVTDGLANGSILTIVGRGSTPAHALERARAAAKAALRLGVPASRVSLRAGGAGSDVELAIVAKAAS